MVIEDDIDESLKNRIQLKGSSLQVLPITPTTLLITRVVI